MTNTDMSRKEVALLKVGTRLDNILSGVTKLGVAYLGFKAANHWTGAIAGLVALRLAESGNAPAGVAGLATLGFIGANQVEDNSLGAGLSTGLVHTDPDTGDQYYLPWWGGGGF